ncbi:hypothetical protein QQZ08_010036 [Neonectria magnoliae]|uniref:AB hydrolase-1 domain-containing protein n=1 Tax=Neonectria magnoliae TaxID=2732573 RepID=A0ABR1HJU9_9HYPO
MPFLEVNGKSLFYAKADPSSTTQKETTFVFIHGLGSSHSFYIPLMTRLANDGYPCIAFDTHGSGLSELRPDHEPTSIGSISKDVKGIIQHLGVSTKSVIAVGHSMGAIVVSELATTLDLRAAILAGPVLPKPALAQIFTARIETVKKYGYNSLCRVIAEAERPDYSLARCPLLILAGEEDKTSPITDAQVICEEWGCKSENKSIKILEGVGHWHCIEAADAVGTFILEFI